MISHYFAFVKTFRSGFYKSVAKKMIGFPRGARTSLFPCPFYILKIVYLLTN